MDLKFKRKNKTLIILVAGEIDHHSSKELRSKQKVPWSKWEEEILSSGFRR